MPDRIKESDWKLLNKSLPGWQEAHMEKLLKGYKELLAAAGCGSPLLGA